jgi:hypothetical protein
MYLALMQRTLLCDLQTVNRLLHINVHLRRFAHGQLNSSHQSPPKYLPCGAPINWHSVLGKRAKATMSTNLPTLQYSTVYLVQPNLRIEYTLMQRMYTLVSFAHGQPTSSHQRPPSRRSFAQGQPNSSHQSLPVSIHQTRYVPTCTWYNLYVDSILTSIVA